MHVARLYAENFRCFKQIDIEPGPGINVITGDNASGKTSILEALYFLGRGHSFRQARTRSIIRRDQSAFVLSAQVRGVGNRGNRLAVQRTRTAINYKLDNESSTSRLDLVNTLPLQLVDPNVHRLLEQGPRYRRHFLDWGVFHVEHAFFPAWRRYRRALRQRNRAIKARWPKKDIVPWDAELVLNADIVDACRRAYIDQLREHLPAGAQRLLGDDAVQLEYTSGWRGDDGYGAVLARNLAQDLRAGFTQQGPHRADLRVSVAGTAAKDWVSRGQQKVLTSVLLLVQARLLNLKRGIAPVLLIDDLAAELGHEYRELLALEIMELGVQCFMSFLDASLVPAGLGDYRRFHVEHGRVGAL